MPALEGSAALPALRHEEEIDASIEMLWRQFRRDVTHCELFETVNALLVAARDFFGCCNDSPDKVLSIIGANPA